MLKRIPQPDPTPLREVSLYAVTCGALGPGRRRLAQPRWAVVAAADEVEAVGTVRDLMAYCGLVMFGELVVERLD